MKNINIDLRDNKKYSVIEQDGEISLVPITEEEFNLLITNIDKTT